MIGIIGAMPEEVEKVLLLMNDSEIIEHSSRIFYKGHINHHEVVVVLAGIGKVNAAITTTILLEQFDIDKVVNIGVAGGQHGVNHMDIVVSRSVLYHDVDVTYFGTYVHGQLPGHDPEFMADGHLVDHSVEVLNKLEIPYHVGRIATGDQFVYSSDFIFELNQLYTDIYAIEMEAAAIAHTATLYRVPFIIFRSISDVLDDETQQEDFNEFLVKASEQVSEFLVTLLDYIG